MVMFTWCRKRAVRQEFIRFQFDRISGSIMYLHLPVKFIGLVMASYLSIDRATSTYVELYVTTACMNLISLQATFPACQVTVVLQIISVSTDIKPTNKSATRYMEPSNVIHRENKSYYYNSLPTNDHLIRQWMNSLEKDTRFVNPFTLH